MTKFRAFAACAGCYSTWFVLHTLNHLEWTPNTVQAVVLGVFSMVAAGQFAAAYFCKE